MSDASKPFVSRAEHFERNLRDSQRTTAGPAIRMDRDGQGHPGVIITTGTSRFTILTPADAMRIATGIADVLTEQRQDTAA